MRDVLNATDYAVTVDPAPATDGELFATLFERADFRNYSEIDDLRDPVDIEGSAVAPRRTGIMTPLPQLESAGVDIVNDAAVNWTTSNAVEFDVGEQRNSQWEFETEYRIPAEHVGVQVPTKAAEPDERRSANGFCHIVVNRCHVGAPYRGVVCVTG